MRSILSPGISLMILSVLILASFSDNAEALPTFARKYKTSCMLCHSIYPQLTPMGEAFRLNGYKIPEADEIYIKEEPLSLGAEPYKKVFPEAVWPSSIPGPPPLSLRFIGNVNCHPFGKQTNRSEFNFPNELDLLAGGAFGEDFAFFANVGIDRNDDGTYSTTPEGWLMLQNFLSGLIGKNHLNLTAGKVGKYTIALQNTRTENSITIENYLYADQYNLGSQPGFEMNGFGRHWRYAAGVVQGDSDSSRKDMYASFAVKFGGLGYDGSGGRNEAGGLSTTPSGYWRDDSVSLGFFAYRGYLGVNSDTYNLIGGDARVNYKDLSLAGGFIRGHHVQNVQSYGPPYEDNHIWFGEAQYFLYPWLVPYLRYEDLSVKNVNNEDLSRFIVGLGILIRANIKASVEGRFFSNNQPAKLVEGNEMAEDQVAFQLDWAF